jgi:hypothetical protein
MSTNCVLAWELDIDIEQVQCPGLGISKVGPGQLTCADDNIAGISCGSFIGQSGSVVKAAEAYLVQTVGHKAS